MVFRDVTHPNYLWRNFVVLFQVHSFETFISEGGSFISWLNRVKIFIIPVRLYFRHLYRASEPLSILSTHWGKFRLRSWINGQEMRGLGFRGKLSVNFVEHESFYQIYFVWRSLASNFTIKIKLDERFY